ncbi:MAG: hypothetical protein ACYC75_01375, partial [Minisyncoccota bacterium]
TGSIPSPKALSVFPPAPAPLTACVPYPSRLAEVVQLLIELASSVFNGKAAENPITVLIPVMKWLY